MCLQTITIFVLSICLAQHSTSFKAFLLLFQLSFFNLLLLSQMWRGLALALGIICAVQSMMLFLMTATPEKQVVENVAYRCSKTDTNIVSQFSDDVSSEPDKTYQGEHDCSSLITFLSKYTNNYSPPLYDFLNTNVGVSDYNKLVEYGKACNIDIHEFVEKRVMQYTWESKDKPRILVTNSAVMNTGDAAILLSTLRLIREALNELELEVIVFDLFGAKGRKFGVEHYPQAKFLPLDPKKVPLKNTKALDALAGGRLLEGMEYLQSYNQLDQLWITAQSDIVVASGGTYIVPHYPQDTRLRIYHTINALAPGRFMMMTQSMGPFHQKWKSEFRGIVKHTSLILLRDEKSQNYLKELAPQDTDRTHVVADSVFGMLSEEELNNNIHTYKERFNNYRKIKKVAVNVRNWGNKGLMSNFLGSVAKAVEALLENDSDMNIEFVSTCQGVPGYKDDSKQAKEVVDQLSSKYQSRVIINNEWHDPYSLLEKYKEFDLVISTRMHGAVLSLMGGIPVLPIEYEFKMSELFRRLGHPEWVTSVKFIKPRSFSKLALDMVDQLENSYLYNSLMDGVLQQQRSAWETSTYIKNTFFKIEK
eukprot:gb/GECH01008851.1/.p1 GENE.gb/GECH01008851.1/~~gb/GECH01008851.1/.p1  ORF type:complete len:590 (+),score=48.49 gb/GECH01008851.1/:1-1770(+)